MDLLFNVYTLIDSYIVIPLPFTIVTLAFGKAIFRDQIKLSLSLKIIQWTLIGFGIINFAIFFSDDMIANYLNTTNIITVIVTLISLFSPFLFFLKRFKRSLLFLFLGSIMVKLSWYFMAFVITSTQLYRNENYSEVMQAILVQLLIISCIGIFTGLLLLFLDRKPTNYSSDIIDDKLS